MPWTTPRTWVTGEQVTGYLLNQQIRENLNSLFDGDSCCVTRTTSATIAVTENNDVAIPFETAVWDDAGFWSSSTPTRLTPKKAGAYVVQGAVEFQLSTAGRARFYLRRNGVSGGAVNETIGGRETSFRADEPCAVQLEGAWYFNGTTDYVELVVGRHTITTLVSSYAPYLSLARQ